MYYTSMKMYLMNNISGGVKAFRTGGGHGDGVAVLDLVTAHGGGEFGSMDCRG